VKAGFLLDVNILIAMAWPTHRAHEKAQDWLAPHAREGWATCPLTQTAFVRILSNPAFSPNALTPGDALALLRANLAHPAPRTGMGTLRPAIDGPSTSDRCLFVRGDVFRYSLPENCFCATSNLEVEPCAETNQE
jgi:predicted nucleic acid-binding protein